MSDKDKQASLDKSDSNNIKPTAAKSSKGKAKFKAKGRKGGTSRKPINDPSWYVIDDTIAKQIGSIPFSIYPGLTYPIIDSPSWTNGSGNLVIPGVAVFKYLPVLNTNVPGRAVDLTAKALYQFIRRNTSGGAKVYQSSDVLMYLLAMDSIYLAIHQVKRILRTFNSYKLSNRLIPRAILRSLGIPEVERFDYAALVARLNLSIARVNSVAVPQDFNLFKRRAVLGSVVLSDDGEEPTQILIPHADIVYAYYSAGISGGELLGFDYFREDLSSDDTVKPPFTMKQLLMDQGKLEENRGSIDRALRNIEAMLDRVLFDDDMSIIGGDIQRAYEGNLYQLPYLETLETIDYTYDEDLWQQFKTSTVLDVPGGSLNSWEAAEKGGIYFKNGDSSTLDVQPAMAQISNQFICSPFVDTTKLGDKTAACILPSLKYTHFVCSTNENPDPGKIIEWTRLLTFVIEPEVEGQHAYYRVISGTEMGLAWLVYTENKTNNTMYYLEQWMQFGNEWPADPGADYISSATTDISFTIVTEGAVADKKYRVASKSGAANYMNALRHRPRLYGVNWFQVLTQPWNNNTYAVTTAGRIENHTAIIPKSQIILLHDSSIYGLLANPQLKLK